MKLSLPFPSAPLGLCLTAILCASAGAQNQNVLTTYIGGEAGDRAQGVWVLSNGDVLVCGETQSNLEQANPYPNHQDPLLPFDTTLPGYDQTHGGGTDGWIAVLNPEMTTIRYWTYIGGIGQDRVYFAMEDASGDIWATGFTTSKCDEFYAGVTDCTYKNGTQNYNPSNQDPDVFVVRLSFDLEDLELSMLIGGDDHENPRGNLWVTQEGPRFYAYVSGRTSSGPGSTGFHTTVTPPVAAGNEDGFLLKIRDDRALMWSTAYGGQGNDNAWANPRKHPTEDWVYIAGCTTSTDLPIPPPPYAPYQANLNGAFDGYVARFNSLDGSLQAATYLGGTEADWVTFNDCLELDHLGRPVVVGQTRSDNFPITPDHLPNGANHSRQGQPVPTDPNQAPRWNDIFLSILSADLTVLEFSTYVNGIYADGETEGAAEREEPAGLAVDSEGYIYITGETLSPGFPVTSNAYDPTFTTSGHNDSFLVRIFDRPVGHAVPATQLYGTFFGGDTPSGTTGEGGSRGRSLSIIPSSGHALFSGVTAMTDFPVTPPVLIGSWFPGDDRTGFISIHDTKQ